MMQRWTTPLHEFIETLTCRVRVMSLPQARRAWAAIDSDGADINVALQQLIHAGLVTGEVRRVAVVALGEAPLFAWDPGDTEPDCQRLAKQVCDRWPAVRMQTPLIAATKKACRLFGASGGGIPPEAHTTHDLILAEVYLRYRLSQPRVAASWLGEDACPLAERGVKNPDAYLLEDSASRRLVIESAGRYSDHQIRAFHDHCSAESLSYELW